MADNIFGLTDTGRIRDNNEDTFIAQPVVSNQYLLACVIDGVGGYNGGEVAAAIAREQILYQFAAKPVDINATMLQAFKQANENIYSERLRVKEMDSMACVATLALVDVENNQFHYAHIGDTRLYLLRDHSLVKITKDHSFVGFLEDTGRLTESAAMNHPKRNEINKALGFASPIDTNGDYIETGMSPFLPGDMLLLCSDGLTDMVDKDTITSIITAPNQPLHKKAADLIEVANHHGGKDNITVVLVQNTKEPLKQEVTKPATALKKKENLKAEEPVPAKQPVAMPVTQPVSTSIDNKSSNGLVPILSVLCLLFLASTIWLFLRSRKENVTVEPVVKAATKAKSIWEVKLQDAINHAKGDTLVLSDSVFKQPIVISDTIRVQADTLYIKTKGKIELVRDSSYAGPALQLASNCKYVVLNGLILQGFNIGVSAYNDALQLKNTQFNNCRLPLQVFYMVADNRLTTGRLPILKFKSDTLAQPTNKKNGAR